MGKDKHGQRTKNNVRPSSSGRTAEMLGTAPINPFMSFTSLKESMGVDEQMADSHLDPNFQVVLKKMNKKDGVTKLKALQEFSQLCESSEPDQVIAILPFWPRLYSVLALDVEHRVREASHIAHRAVLTKVKRNIAPHLKQLSGPWFVAQCDTYAPAASAASLAFNETFPAQKMSEAIAFCQEEILNYIYENLIVHTPQTLCNAKTMTPEEIEAKYIRTVTSSLQGYGLYLSRLTSDQLHSAEELNRKLVSDSKYWKFSKHQSPQVRSAWFSALIALCQNAHFLLLGEEKRIGQAVFGSLDENEATVLPVIWEAALVALVAIDGLFEAISFEKLMLPKLLKVCREGGKGSAAAIFPSLLPLLSKMPTDIVKGASTFHQKFFSSFKQGFSHRTVQTSLSESKAVANAFVECLQYVIQLNQDNEILCQELLKDQLLPCICKTLLSNRRAYACDALYLSVSKLLHSWGRSAESSPQRKLLRFFCSDMSACLKNMALGEISSETVDSTSTETDTHSVENTENTEGRSVKEGKAMLKDILRSQVDFITCLMEEQKPQGKVKFADANLADMPERRPTNKEKSSTTDVADSEIIAMGKSLCCCYMLCLKEKACVDYLQPLVLLIVVLNSSSTYSDMAKAVNMSSKQQLFSELLINWMKPHNPLFCHAAVALSMPLLHCLSTEEQNILFDQLLQDGLNMNQLQWLVEENIASNGVVSNWLRNPGLAPILKSLTEEATTSDEVTSTWKLLLSGCSIASDGDHIFCHSALRDIFDVFVEQLEERWHSSSTLPPWTSVAADTILKLYCEQSPFLRSLPSPQKALSVAFEICLWEPDSSPDIESLSLLWKNGAKVLARVHGSSSPVVLQLCSSFVKAALTLLYGRFSHSRTVLEHIASQFTKFIEIVIDCFPSVDGENEKRKTCSLLLTTLFSISKSNTEGTSELRDILALHRNGLEWLADCVEPMHPGIDSSQSIPRGNLTELIGAGYWGVIVAFVLKTLSLPSLCKSVDDHQEDTLFSWEIFLDVFVLASDVKYISHHFASTELGSALHQLTRDTEDTLVEIISCFKPQKAEKIHDLLLERCDKNAACDRAHRTWHILSSRIPTQQCDYWKLAAFNDMCLEDETLKNINLSPLDVLAENLLKQGLTDDLKPQALLWLDTVHKLHVRCNWRLVSNQSINSYPLVIVHDTSRVLKFLNAVVFKAPELLAGRNWDQVMIAMATWLHCAHESVREKGNEHEGASRMSIKICAFIQEICKLFVSFNQVISKLQVGSIELVDLERGSLNESLPREWKDVFVGECEQMIFTIWTEIVEKVKPSEESPPIVALLDELGRALQYSSTAFLQPSRDAEVAYETLLEYVPPCLLHSLGSVRLAAYHLLIKIVPDMVKHDAASLANINSEEEAEAQVNSEERLSLLRFEDILLQAQTVVSTMLSEVRLGKSCTVQPFTDAYTYSSGYLLIWSLMLEMCKEAETELKCQYAMWLKNVPENCAETLLNNVFRLLPQEAFDVKIKKPLEYFSTRPKLSFRDPWTSALVQHLACDVLFGALCCLPALTRVWWTSSEPKVAALIDQVVSKHLSPFVCSAEMAAVAKMQDKTVENMSVRVHPAVREVVAVYTVDDLAMELVVRLPTNHPLTPMIVEVGKRNAAAAVQWRQWLMQLTMFLTHQNGSLWDGLALWRNNVVRRYEGVEECYVCYCVLSGANYQLPKLSCRTCRKKFHTACLYKWFQTSNKSTCPICRNLF